MPLYLTAISPQYQTIVMGVERAMDGLLSEIIGAGTAAASSEVVGSASVTIRESCYVDNKYGSRVWSK
jgi:hypothetical protein